MPTRVSIAREHDRETRPDLEERFANGVAWLVVLSFLGIGAVAAIGWLGV